MGPVESHRGAARATTFPVRPLIGEGSARTLEAIRDLIRDAPAPRRGAPRRPAQVRAAVPSSSRPRSRATPQKLAHTRRGPQGGRASACTSDMVEKLPRAARLRGARRGRRAEARARLRGRRRGRRPRPAGRPPRPRPRAARGARRPEGDGRLSRPRALPAEPLDRPRQDRRGPVELGDCTCSPVRCATRMSPGPNTQASAPMPITSGSSVPKGTVVARSRSPPRGTGPPRPRAGVTAAASVRSGAISDREPPARPRREPRAGVLEEPERAPGVLARQRPPLVGEAALARDDVARLARPARRRRSRWCAAARRRRPSRGAAPRRSPRRRGQSRPSAWMAEAPTSG